MGIQYFWHDDPLEPRSVLSDSKAHCYVCQKPVSGYNYKCPKCNFFLHISCLKLPLESLHPLHQDHPLTLLNQLPLDVSNNHEIPCNKCNNPCSGFTYHCESCCSFNLHIQCTIEEYSLNLEIHKQHPLTFSAWPPNGFESFLCNMCGECGFGFCFVCKICQFVVHVECSLLPSKVKYGYYQRTCNLISVQSIEDGTGEFYCSICEKRVNEKGSIYYCADSEYIGHLGCMISISELRFKPAYKDIAVSSSDLFDAQKCHDSTFDNRTEMQLGKDEDEELSKMRQRFRELLTGKDKPVSYTMSHELEQNFKKDHFSHEHPLVFDDDYQNNGHMCYACWLPISRFAYGCTKCNFFLHKWCAELPLKIQHPVHNQHSLSLVSSNPHYGGCDACGHTLEGFTYTCKSCYFNLHSICASVPRILRNEIHQHPLILCRKTLYSSKCSCCKEDCIGIVFECEMCNLVLDFKCALLPHKIKHDCHIDPLVLTSLVEDEDDEYYCNACEERRQPNHWVYYCAGCEFSAHLICVVSELVGGFPKEGPIDFNCHEHLLYLITNVAS